MLTTPLREDAFHAASYQLAGELAKAGVKFAFATSDAAYARNLPYHAAMSVAWGLDRDEALKALTINAAEILGVADRVGSLEAGKDANLFIVQGRSARGPDAGDPSGDRRTRRGARQQAARALPEIHGTDRRPQPTQTMGESSNDAYGSIQPVGRRGRARAWSLAARADAPHVYAIKGARLVTVAGAPVASGTIVVRNGLIDAVGADVQPPADAVVIDGAGSTVYPGLIDMGTRVGTRHHARRAAAAPRSARSTRRSAGSATWSCGRT